ncbi:MAG: hypothetical protein AB7Q00_11745 [Phycisphaerales bacterium]
MILAGMAALAMSALGGCGGEDPGHLAGYNNFGRAIATRHCEPSVYTVTNRSGNEWHSRRDNTSCGCEGPGAYGASHAHQSVHVRVGQVVVSIPAWGRQDDRHLETARNRWLEERGYVNRVRTFRNPAYAPSRQSSAAPIVERDMIVQKKGPIQPRAIFRLNPEVTGYRSKMQVRATPMKASSVIVYHGPLTEGKKVADARK